MRILRTSMYPPVGDPMTVVMREEDLRVPIEEAANLQGAPAPGAFIITDIFELHPEGSSDWISIEEATLRAIERQGERDERERDMALLYYWDAAALRRVTPGGVLTATEPAPLNTEEIAVALTQLAVHPHYRGQTVLCIAEDLKVVTMREGKCKVETVEL